MKNFAAILGAASLAVALPAAPARAGGGDITNFVVRNCTTERMFVCSFDKTDSLMKIPYKAAGVKPGEKKEFGCASLDKCKVIIGVSKKRSKEILPGNVEAAMATAAGGGGVVAGISVATFYSLAALGGSTAIAVTGGVAGAVIAVGLGGAVAGIEIAEGWKDGDVCNEVRKAAQKAGMKPKSFMKNGNTYRVSERYATDENGNLYVNSDGTAVMAYVPEKQSGACPNPLAKQLVKN